MAVRSVHLTQFYNPLLHTTIRGEHSCVELCKNTTTSHFHTDISSQLYTKDLSSALRVSEREQRMQKERKKVELSGVE